MDITTSSASPYKNILEDMLKNKNAELASQDAQLPVDTPEQALSSVAPKASAPARLMDQNFVDYSKGESKYIKARKNALESDKNMLNRQNSILATALAEKAALDEDASRAALTLIGKKAARRIREEMLSSVREESEPYLEASRKRLAQETEEVLAPKDADGNPAPEVTPEQDNNVSSSSVAPKADIPVLPNPINNAAPELKTEQAASVELTSSDKANESPQLDKYI